MFHDAFSRTYDQTFEKWNRYYFITITFISPLNYSENAILIFYIMQISVMYYLWI